jgi:hypothetical protein
LNLKQTKIKHKKEVQHIGTYIGIPIYAYRYILNEAFVFPIKYLYPVSMSKCSW